MENKNIYGGIPYSARSFYGVSFDGKSGWTDGTPGLGGWHTWDDWGAYWTDIAINAPETEIYTIDVPGRHGVLDLSEALTGAPVYKNRQVTVTLAYPGSGTQWHEEYSEILRELHGRTVQMILDSDPDYYYEGRCTVSSQRKDNFYSTFTITVDAYPYKYETADSLGDWLWDAFSFENGVIRQYDAIAVSPENPVTVHLIGSEMVTYPKITVTVDEDATNAGCYYSIDGGETYNRLTAEAGTPMVYTNLFPLTADGLDVTFTCVMGDETTDPCTISIAYRGGKL